jgi:hypothetical protein
MRIRNPFFPEIANTWTKTQQFTSAIALTGSGITSGYGVNAPVRGVVLVLNNNNSALGFDEFGNIIPINPSQMGSGATWNVFNSNGDQAFEIIVAGSTSPWRFISPGKANGIALGTTPAASAPTIASGTVYQNTTASYQTFDIPVYASTSGTAGTVAVAYGTSSTPSTVYTQAVSGSTSSSAVGVVHLRVPPQLYYELTTSGATIGTVTMVQE